MFEDIDNQMATLKELARRVAESSDDAPPKEEVVFEERIAQRKVPQTVAITSGKGGVGKTVATVNLAIQFARRGLKVLLIDADLGLANIDVVLGLTPKYTIQDVLDGRMSLGQIAVKGPLGITILPAASGVAELSDLTEMQRLALMDHIDNWNADFDIVLVDTGAGISPNVRYFILAVERIMLVATPDPASVTDAYALMKVMFTNHRIAQFDLLINQVKTRAEAMEVYRTLYRVADKFLNIGLNYAGFIPSDEHLVQAIRVQQPVSELYPTAPASMAFQDLSGKLIDFWKQNREEHGRMTFFWRRLLDESTAQPASSE
ncbi:MinD/ParA family protein [Magnetococcales bacterium HHB-1]